MTDSATAVMEAEARFETANRDFVQAELTLRYCLQVGQSLMAIRSQIDSLADA